jgi:hypothetical protein
MIAAVIHVVAETRSFERAESTLRHVLGHGPSAKTIERLAHQVGRELSERNEASTLEKEVVVAEVAVVSCDGGRIRTRAADARPGVYEAAWRETKNSLFERMSAPRIAVVDPCPALPDTFRRVAHVAKIAEQSAFSGVSEGPNEGTSEETNEASTAYKGPERVLRTCVSSMACSDDFGEQMKREAQRRRFHEASRRVFIGDGLAWNWSIWQAHFKTFTPILDFIHAVQYLYAAAAAWETEGPACWQRYLTLAEAVWQGRVVDVVAAIRSELANRGVAEEVPEGDPLRPLADAARYFTNNRERMDYPRYRREGLPITSSPIESLIKQINHRVKGTEMFWLQPAGAEAILQIRAASLSEDGRLQDYLHRRPGHKFTRRPPLALAA